MLRRILNAYVLRNPTIGYCQGMHNIVARLITVMEEEQAFWTLAQIIEQILPLDYYSNMLGVFIEQQIFSSLMEARFPTLCEHL